MSSSFHFRGRDGHCVSSGLVCQSQIRCQITIISLLILIGLSLPVRAEKNPNFDRIESLWKNRQPLLAHALVDSLLPAARSRRDTTMMVGLLGWRGRMYGALGRSAESLAPLHETLDLARATRDTASQCLACRWLAVSYTTQGHFDRGGPYYDELAGLARAAGLKTYLGWGLAGQGYYRSFAGDESEAERMYRESIQIFREQNLPEMENFVLQLLGDCLMDQGAFDEARECFERSGQIGRQKGSFFLQGLSCSNLGRLEVQTGDPQAGLDHFREASRLFIRDGSVHAALEARLQVAHCLVTLQNEKQAADELLILQNEAEAGGFLQLESDVLIQMARLDQRVSDRNKTIAKLEAFLDGPLSGDGNAVCNVMLSLAESYRQRDGADHALALIETRLEKLLPLVGKTEFLELELVRGKLLQETKSWGRALELLLTVADQADSLKLVGLELQALPPAAAAAEAMGRDEDALQLLQRAGRVWLRQRALPLDPHWREVYGAQSRNIYIQLATLLLRFPEEDPLGNRVARAFDAIQVFKARTLEERLVGPGKATRIRKGITLQEIQSKILSPNQVLLDYFTGEKAGLVFKVSSDTCLVFNLPGSLEIANRLQLLHDYISDPDRAIQATETNKFLPEVIHKIRDEIIAPDPQIIPRDGVIIWSPDGDLNLFPMTLALDSSEQPVFRVPSASILGDLRKREPFLPKNRGLLLAVGCPRDGLPAIGLELDDLKHYRGCRCLSSVSSEGISGALAEADYLHFSTHARADALAPWNSYLEIPTSEDSVFFRLDAATISAMRLPAQLVVLAGCESAAGRIMGAEGVQSLANAFIGAGVPSVLATLWPVDDKATRLLIRSFYSHLSSGMNTAEALQAAQAELKELPGYSDPFFWAGFIIAGDGEMEIRLERHPFQGHYLLWLLPVVLLIFLRRQIFRE